MDFHDILLVSDFDYTLTKSDHSIPRENIAAIERFIQAGGAFTVATGRAKATFAQYHSQIPTNAPCIVANGAMIYDFGRDQPLHLSPLDEYERGAIRALASRFCRITTLLLESGPEVYLPDEVYAAAENDYTLKHYAETGVAARRAALDSIPLPWLKAVFTGGEDTLHALEQAAGELGVGGVRSFSFMFEIQNRDTDKGKAARWLADRLGRRTLVCAGDAPNDLAMLREADVAFVPESAAEEMRLDGFRVSAHIDLGTIADIVATLEKM